MRKPGVCCAWPSDIQAFDILKGSPDIHWTITFFHAQQAVEKSLKAVLFTHLIEFRRTHNLPELASLLHQDGVEAPLSDDQLLWLNPFAVTFRYDEVQVPWVEPDEVAEWVAGMRK